MVYKKQNYMTNPALKEQADVAVLEKEKRKKEQEKNTDNSNTTLDDEKENNDDPNVISGEGESLEEDENEF